MSDLIERVAQQPRLRIAFWVGAVVFWVLSTIQVGAYAAIGIGLLVVLLAFTAWRRRRLGAEHRKREEPRWIRPVLVPLLAIAGLLLIASFFDDRDALSKAIDGVLLIQVVLLGLMLAKGQLLEGSAGSDGSTAEKK